MWWWIGCAEPRDDDAPRPPEPEPPDHSSGPVEPTGDTAPPEPPPNVLLVILDDLGTDRLGVYGNAQARTPTLDGLAAQGRWYRNAWGYPSCAPARAAMVTGRHAPRTGFGENATTGPYGLDRAQTTLAEVLGAAGYDSAWVGKWHLENELRGREFEGPTAHGWGSFVGTVANVEDYYDWEKVLRDGTRTRTTRYVTTDETDEALAELGRLEEPWLLTVAYHAPHGPPHVPPPHLTTIDFDPGDYGGAINAMTEAMDKELGRLLAGLTVEERARTLILAVGDNGDLLDGNRTALFTGKVTLADAGVAVPFLVAGPGVGAPGPSDALVSVVDVLPTLAEVVGFDLGTLRGVQDPGAPLALDGRSAWPSLVDAEARGHDLLLTGRFSPDGPPPWNFRETAVRDDHHELWVDRDDLARLFTYGRGGPGPPKREADWTPAEHAAADSLRAQMEAVVSAMPYDGHR